MATHTKVKVFTSALAAPLATPDGTSIEEQVTAFLATLTNSNVSDVIVQMQSTGKYGTNTTFFATVVYQG